MHHFIILISVCSYINFTKIRCNICCDKHMHPILNNIFYDTFTLFRVSVIIKKSRKIFLLI